MSLVAAVALSLARLDADAAETKDSSAALKPVIACRSVADEAARLRCYDSTVQVLADRSATGSIIIVNKEDVRQARRSAFGLTLPRLPFFDNNDQEGEPQEVLASVEAARSLGHGLWELNLNAAGVWRTTEALTSAKTPKQGQEIRISKGAFGSYFLRMADGRSVKGLRIR